jgi:hypothetical protein
MLSDDAACSSLVKIDMELVQGLEPFPMQPIFCLALLEKIRVTTILRPAFLYADCTQILNLAVGIGIPRTKIVQSDAN